MAGPVWFTSSIRRRILGLAQVLQEVDAAVAWADERPYPDPATLLGGVYDGE